MKDRVRPAYLVLFASVYALQGVVFAYFVTFNHGYMTAAGVSPDAASDVQSLALVPFILKFLAGPFSDRFNLLGLGHRRPYVLLGIIIQTLGLLGLAAVNPHDHLALFATLAVLTVTGLALYDTCCDGMVVDVTPPADRSRVQAILIVARFLSATVCALGFGFWLQRTGTGPGKGMGVLWACAALGIVPFTLALLVREPKRADDAERFQWSAFRVLILPRSLVLLAFGAAYSTIGYGVEINLSPFYTSLGFGEADLGALGSTRSIGRAIGAALLPLGMARLGRGPVLTLAIVGLGLTSGAQAFVQGRFDAGFAALTFGAANGWSDALFYVLAMEASDPRMAASTYALFMAVSNVSVVGGSLFAKTVKAFGDRYAPAFVLAMILGLLALPTVAVLRKPKPVDPELDGV